MRRREGRRGEEGCGIPKYLAATDKTRNVVQLIVILLQSFLIIRF